MQRLLKKKLSGIFGFVVLAWLLVACGGGIGGGPGPAPDPSRPRTFSVSGVVVDVSGAPMEGVQIVFDGVSDTVTTDGDGRWRMTGFADRVGVTPVRDGYEFYPQGTTAFGERDDVVFTAASSAVLDEQCVEGDPGSRDDPCVLETIEQVQHIVFRLDGHFVLGGDIAAGGTQTWFDGRGFLPIGGPDELFTGSFDGQDYVIGDLYIHRPDEESVGLFGGVDSGPGLEPTIQRVGLVDVDVTGDWFVGGLVGMNRGYIQGVSTTGVVAGDNTVGGLVGSHNSGMIFGSYSEADVEADVYAGGLAGSSRAVVRSSYSTGRVSGEETVGGLIGYRTGGTVDKTYSTGAVDGFMNVGGLIGSNSTGELSESYSTGPVTGAGWQIGGLVGANGGRIVNSYSLSPVEGPVHVGGLVGTTSINIGDGYVTNSYAAGPVVRSSGGDGPDVGGLVGSGVPEQVAASYWDRDATGQRASPGGGEGRTTAQLQGGKTGHTFGPWDDNVWDFSGDGYPVLIANRPPAD